MRLVLSLVLACAVSSGAQAAGQAQEPASGSDSSRVRTLVEAGVLPRATLEVADLALADVQDDAVLQRTLYGNISVQDLTEEQASEMLAAATRRFERRRAKLDEARKLVEAGAAPRLYLTPFLEELDRSRRTLDLAQIRAQVLRELADIVHREEPALTSPGNMLPEMSALTEHFNGAGSFSTTDVVRIETEFTKQFGRPLPVSARGETALHRSLGFDHRGRVDVALDPDNSEGRWLRGLLQNLQIPYFAFRTSVRGKSTGPHIHIGPPSEIRHGG